MSLKNHGWREVVKVLSLHGFRVDRQRGSHIILLHDDGRYVTVPRYDPIKKVFSSRSLTRRASLEKSS